MIQNAKHNKILYYNITAGSWRYPSCITRRGCRRFTPKTIALPFSAGYNEYDLKNLGIR